MLAGSCRWRRRVGARPLGPRLHLQDYKGRMAACTGRPARAGARGDGRTDRTTALVGGGGTPEVVGTWPFRSCPPRQAVSGDRTTLHRRRTRTLLDAGLDRQARRDSAPVHGVCGFDQLHGGTQLAVAGHGGRPVVPAGLGLRARCSTSQHSRLSLRARGSTSLPCGIEPPGEGGGSPASFIAGLSLPPRGSTSLSGGTQPPGAGQRGWISRAGGTQPPGSGPRRLPYRPGGTEPPSPGLHQPALWD